MVKRVLSFTLAVLMMISIGALAGCGGSGSAQTSPSAGETAAQKETTEQATVKEETEVSQINAQPVTIKYTHFSAGENHAKDLEAMMAVFQKKYPNIKVESEPVGFGEIFTRLATQIAAGNAPDCFELNMENFQPFAFKDVITDLGPVLDKAGINAGAYNKGALDACTINGKLYALPLSYSTVVLFYNKALFDQAGVAYPTKDWTWNEELEAARKIKALGEDTWGVFQEIQLWEFYKTIQKNNGSLLSSDNSKFTLNTPENIETLQYMSDRIWVSKVMPSDRDRADRSGVDLFVDGKLGMLYGGIWSLNEVNTKVDGKFNWGVEIEPGAKKKACFFFANVGCLSTTTKNSEAAALFLYELGTNAENVNIRLDSQWELPTVSDNEVLKKYTAVTPPDNKQAVIDSMNYAVRPPVIEQFQQFADIVNPRLQSLQASGKKSAKEILEDAQKQVEEKISIK